MSFCFRLRFKLGDTVEIKTTSSQLVLSKDPSELVILKPRAQELTLSDARQLILSGERYGSEEEASEAAVRWRAHLQAALARCNVGADFGERAPQGAFTQHGLAMVAGESGSRVLNDVHGTSVFACEPQPVFASMGPFRAKVGKPAERLSEAIRSARQRGVALSDREQLAYDLYSASFFQSSADARFVLLMMALETLLDPQDRSPEVLAHVDTLLAATRRSGLPDNEVNSIVGSLTYMRKESIGQAGRRLVQALGERRYMDERPTQFFTRCYAMRSQLVHGHYPLPTRTEVDRRAASLELFVSHLLSGELLITIPTRPAVY